MRIRRSRLTRDFVQVPNATARDDRLSHMARGILVDLLSRPDGWETTADEMWRASVKRHGKAGPGRRAFRAAFAELKEHGYLVAERAPLARGQHGTVLTLHDISAGGTDVPDSAPRSEEGEGERAGGTDVPDSASRSEKYHRRDTASGTSVPPAETDEPAGGTDVPPTDVPHAGTSNRRRSTNTGKKTVGGSGRRPTPVSSGAGSSGSAALADEHTDEVQVAAIGCVIGLLPARLRDQLPSPVPNAVADTIRAELARGITTGQLTDRAKRRWVECGYEIDAESVDGPGILRPVGVAVALVRAGKCTSARCDDGTDLDSGGLCRTCEREAEERRRAASRPVQGAILTPVPSGTTEPTLVPHAPAPRSPAEQLPLQNCDGCDRGHRAANSGDLCGDCRQARRGVSGA